MKTFREKSIGHYFPSQFLASIYIVQKAYARKGTKSSGGSRIFPRGMRQLPKSAIIFQFFPRKLHENGRTWTPRGARVPGAPPLRSANEKFNMSSSPNKTS